MTRFLPARHYLAFGLVALALGLFSGWVGIRFWMPALVPALLFLLTATLLTLLGFFPAVEVQDSVLRVGGRVIPWADIRRLDGTGWLSPLIVRITMYDDSRFTLVYPGDLESCKTLVRSLRRMSRDALIDGVPYRQYWGELLVTSGDRRRVAAAPRQRFLRPEDEADIERLYQKLRQERHLDPKKSSDEK